MRAHALARARARSASPVAAPPAVDDARDASGRPRARGSSSNSTPSSTRSAIRAGASSVSDAHGARPAEAAARAQRVLRVQRRRVVRRRRPRRRRPARASSSRRAAGPSRAAGRRLSAAAHSAAYSPATPPPTMTRSQLGRVVRCSAHGSFRLRVDNLVAESTRFPTPGENSCRRRTPCSPSSSRCATGVLQVLLWERARSRSPARWSLPGGYSRRRRDARGSRSAATSRRRSTCARSRTSSSSRRWSDPDRHPERWELATAYLGLVPPRRRPRAAARTRAGIPSTSCPRLAFDHGAIVARRARAAAREALLHERRLRARAARRSRSRSSATSTRPRSGTTSRRRT